MASRTGTHARPFLAHNPPSIPNPNRHPSTPALARAGLAGHAKVALTDAHARMRARVHRRGKYRASLRSLFRLHNETGNAWTMVALATIAAYLWHVAEVTFLRQAPEADRLAFALMCSAPVLHCPFALGNHLFPGVSERTKVRERARLCVRATRARRAWLAGRYVLRSTVRSSVRFLADALTPSLHSTLRSPFPQSRTRSVLVAQS